MKKVLCQYCKKESINKKKFCDVCAPDKVSYKRIREEKINNEEYLKLLELQRGKCSVCLLDITKSSKIDRNHSGNIRGILCKKCKEKVSVIEDQKFSVVAKNYLNMSKVVSAKEEKNDSKTIPQLDTVYFGNCFDVLKTFPDKFVDLVYVDPPFGTGIVQRLKSVKSFPGGNSSGFGGKKYTNTVKSDFSYTDIHKDYVQDFLLPMMMEAKRILKDTGTFYLHLDRRYVHYAKVMMDLVFGEDCFINHIIWSYNYGGRGKKCFPQKHDDILSYARVSDHHKFNWNEIDKIPYKAPSLQKDPIRAAEGQVPTDVWEMTIVPTNAKARTGYPTQKPRAISERIIRASSDPGDIVIDFCCGSGTTLEASHILGRKWIGIDSNPTAIEVMKKRFSQNGIRASFIDTTTEEE